MWPSTEGERDKKKGRGDCTTWESVLGTSHLSFSVMPVSPRFFVVNTFCRFLGWHSLTVTEKSCEPPAYCKAQGVLDRDGKRLQLPKMCLNHSRKYSETRDSQDSQCMGDQSRQALCSSGDES